MNWLKNFWFRLKQTKKYSASDPNNFEEVWNFTANGIQIISFVTIISILFGIVFTIIMLKGPFASYFSKNDVSIERKNLEALSREMNKVKARLAANEHYLMTLKKIMSGEIVEDSLDENVPEVKSISPSDIQIEATESEKKLNEKVKSDLRTTAKKRPSNLPFFASPIKGKINKEFDYSIHPGVDIRSSKDKNVLACLSGTVLFSGFTSTDGNVIILDHANGFISIYKHNKTVLKKKGMKVQMNDPIAIVGETGENSSGPHLHFELWYNQNAVNPSDYIDFN